MQDCPRGRIGRADRVAQSGLAEAFIAQVG